jgi:hypothetical protein
MTSPLNEPTEAPKRARSPMATSRDSFDGVVGEIDFGKSPEGVLVVREWHGPRLLAIVLAIVVAIPWLLIVVQIVHDENNAGNAVHFGDILSWLLLTLIPGILLAGSVVLLAQWLNGAYYYLALDEHHLYRRRGPRRLLVLPLDDLGPFVLVGRRRDCLAV